MQAALADAVTIACAFAVALASAAADAFASAAIFFCCSVASLAACIHLKITKTIPPNIGAVNDNRLRISKTGIINNSVKPEIPSYISR